MTELFRLPLIGGGLVLAAGAIRFLRKQARKPPKYIVEAAKQVDLLKAQVKNVWEFAERNNLKYCYALIAIRDAQKKLDEANEFLNAQAVGSEMLLHPYCISNHRLNQGKLAAANALRLFEAEQKGEIRYKKPSRFLLWLAQDIAICSEPNLEQMESLARKAVAQAEQPDFESPAKELAECLSYLASVLDRQGKHDEALVTYKRVVHLQLEPGGKRKDLVKTLRSIAAHHAQLGKWRTAEKVQRSLLALLEKGQKERSSELLWTLRDIAELREKQSDTAGAEKLLLTVAEITSKATVKDALQISAARCGLANFYMRRGRHTEALELYQKSLLENESSEDPSAPFQVPNDLRLLATALRQLGREDEAGAAEKRANEEEKAIGIDRESLSRINIPRRRYEDLVPWVQEALQD
jgi:tetratricopeptide (TPR) repeat protein